MTVVIGTAGHIDHGKTTLLRALTGIDADRLPEERRRGMTIDLGYAHLAVDGGPVVDFVDVPGHDKLVGNMLVGAGEIDAVLLVVAADDGIRAQTLEHLALLDALGLAAGVAVITKVDGVETARAKQVTRDVRALLSGTSLAGIPVLSVSATGGAGIDAVREAIARLARTVVPVVDRPPTLAIDRVFAVKGRGVVVTGTLRGGPLARGDHLRLVPGDLEARVRELQVHGETVDAVRDGGRTAINLGGIESERLHRGLVLTTDPAIVASDRLLARFARPIADRARARWHAGTTATDATVGRSGRDALELPDGAIAGIVRLAAPVAVRAGDRFVLRRGGVGTPIGGVVLDAQPPRGVARRRQTPARVAALAQGSADVRLALHGVLPGPGGRADLAADVREAGIDAALAAVDAAAAPIALTALRAATAVAIRRAAGTRRDLAAAAATRVVEDLVADGRLDRTGDLVARAGAGTPVVDPARTAAMDRLEALLAVAAPPPLARAVRTAACPPDGVRELAATGRIVLLEPDLAYAMTAYRELAATALRLATRAPLTPATLRDATGTSRKYVVAILEDLDRKALLRRTPDGHVPGPKAPAPMRAADR